MRGEGGNAICTIAGELSEEKQHLHTSQNTDRCVYFCGIILRPYGIEWYDEL
jgi:hypothetical protein